MKLSTSNSYILVRHLPRYHAWLSWFSTNSDPAIAFTSLSTSIRPDPYPSVPYPQPARVSKPLTITRAHEVDFTDVCFYLGILCGQKLTVTHFQLTQLFQEFQAVSMSLQGDECQISGALLVHIRKTYNTYVGQIGSHRFNRSIGSPLLYTLP